MIGLLRSVVTHAGLSPLCLCCCPDEQANPGGGSFGSRKSSPSINPFMRLDRRAPGDVGTSIATAKKHDRVAAISTDFFEESRLAESPSFVRHDMNVRADGGFGATLGDKASGLPQQNLSLDEWWLLLVACEDDEHH